MEKTITNPWKWSEQTNSAQAVEIKNVKGTLYCSGQVAIDENGNPSNGSIREQLIQTIQNLEHLIKTADYDCKNIVRLNVYTTSTADFFSSCMDVYLPFLQKYDIEQATTLLGINELFANLSIELEATVVK